ncbi:protein YgfX [Neisseria iguanae]|uniref:Transcriptional regulator n=1 Tax=Neisseria iguanae TaxID=90242 RepID=A0A2P7U070_9NEIS|nr:protein YgfX [Neisseria iguanae]PSJ80357.1 transcriptional regulator [Neisseria iguanae]
MFAFQTALTPSRSLKTAVIVLHLIAAVMCAAWFYGAMLWLGLLGLMVSSAYAWRHAGLKGRKAVTQIAVNRLQQAAIFVGREQTAFEAVLGGSSLVTRYVLFLQWHTGSRTMWQLVLPDMLDNETHRRLRVWARWCQAENPVKQKSGFE